MKEPNESNKPKANGLREILVEFWKNQKKWNKLGDNTFPSSNIVIFEIAEKQITSHFDKEFEDKCEHCQNMGGGR